MVPVGMFTNDIMYGGIRLDKAVRIGSIENPEDGEVFILLDAWILPDKLETSLGLAEKTILEICRVDQESWQTTGEVLEVGTLSSAIANKVREKVEGDLPAIVRCHMVPASTVGFNDALVMSFVAKIEPAETKKAAK